MSHLSNDKNRTIALFLNDFDQEYADALDKLSKKLGRKLEGVILADKERQANGRLVPDLKKQFKQIVCDYFDPKSLTKAINPIKDKLLLATFSSDYNATYMRRLVPHISFLNVPSEASLEWCTNKALMRQKLESYDASLVPRAVTVSGYDAKDLAKASKLKFPVIVKPTGLSSSLLVSKAHDIDELNQQLKDGFGLIGTAYAKFSGRGKPEFIVEEFVDEPMYSVDSYVSSGGQTWHLPIIHSETAYHVGQDGFHIHQVETLNNLSSQEIAKAEAAATAAIHALGLRSSVAHIELFKTKEGWKIIELGPRAGGLRQDIYEVAYGIDHAYNEFLIKAGLEPEIKSEVKLHTVAAYIFSETEGEIELIEGFNEAKNRPSVRRLDMKSKPGDMAQHSRNGGMAVVRGVVAHEDAEHLNNEVAELRKLIRIRTR